MSADVSPTSGIGVGRRVRFDRLGLLLGSAALAALALLPFIVFKTSRIASGEALSLFHALPGAGGVGVAALIVAAALVAVAATDVRARLAAGIAGVVVVALAVGYAADLQTPAGDRVVRIAPGAGSWVLLISFLLIATNAVTQFRLRPAVRVGCLALSGLVVYAVFAHGLFDHLSVMREYAVNESSFGREARRHVALALGSLAAAVLVGIPTGVVCHRMPRVRGAVLQTLNLIQTIPSIALFGILMVPLGALSTAYPWIGEMGIHGIGAAPAVIALFLYSLLPVVANTVVGLGRVSPATVDAARGMGLTNWQLLTQVEFVLALPVILTGIRIVLVQNVGLVTIAALIGGGGFGTFVFQGVGQTAIDLVLLGAIPTVALAFVCAVVMDALVEALQRTRP